MSTDIWNELAELGVIGALFTEEQGGFGGAGFDIAVVFEELGRAGVVEPFLDTAVLAGGLIADLGNDDQQAHVEEIIAGSLQLAFAHGEPSSRYDLTRVSTTATEKGDEIVLSGRKAVVVNAEAADMLVVSARESGQSDDAEGISLFLVPKDAKGLTIQGYALLAGGRAAEVTLDDVAVPASARLGEAGKASGRHRDPHRRRQRGPDRRNAGRDGDGDEAHQGLPDDAQAVRAPHRHVPGAGAPHVRSADRDGAGPLRRDHRGRASGRTTAARASGMCLRPRT